MLCWGIEINCFVKQFIREIKEQNNEIKVVILSIQDKFIVLESIFIASCR